MNTNVVFLHGQPPRVGHYVRIGTTAYRQFETLLGAGRMPVDSVVVEAGVATRREELIRALKEADRQIVLDTNVAVLSCLGKFDGKARGAPWADPEAHNT